MYTAQKLALAIAPFVLAAQAFDVPRACTAMCGPADALDKKCDAPDGPNERADETRCICADAAIVRTIFPLCLDCMRQNPPGASQGDDFDADDARDAQAFLSQCGPVSSTQYTPAATSVIQNLGASGSPQTTRPGGAQSTGGAAGTGTGSGGSSGSGSPAATASGSRTTASSQRSGASGVQPLGGVSAAAALYVAGALVAGGAWMLG